MYVPVKNVSTFRHKTVSCQLLRNMTSHVCNSNACYNHRVKLNIKLRHQIKTNHVTFIAFAKYMSLLTPGRVTWFVQYHLSYQHEVLTRKLRFQLFDCFCLFYVAAVAATPLPAVAGCYRNRDQLPRAPHTAQTCLYEPVRDSDPGDSRFSQIRFERILINGTCFRAVKSCDVLKFFW